MENSVHCFIAQYFMNNSHLLLENYSLNADTGHLKCDFKIEDESVVKMSLNYIPAPKENDSWIVLRGEIGRMGEIYNLPRIAEFFNDLTIPQYSLMLERRGRILILGRSCEIIDLDDNRMNRLIDDICKMIRTIRRFMLPHDAEVRGVLRLQ